MICLDASVVVKWFKSGEDKEDLALRLRDEILSFECETVFNEWLILEIVRALTKAEYSFDDAVSSVHDLRDMHQIDVVRIIPVSGVLDLAYVLEHNFRLYAADAVHLATAIGTNSKYLISEDHHLLRSRIKRFASSRNLTVASLDEFYGHLVK
ncbi:MAG: PIN domain-containing protein [Euryarchaeota archaeon]|nr:MAG: hypothetical protein C5S48_07315 [ANME-2 cluster archaeon]MEA1864765.1 PIN domain-containing protein [Euryarchaeota archaeon]